MLELPPLSEQPVLTWPQKALLRQAQRALAEQLAAYHQREQVIREWQMDAARVRLVLQQRPPDPE